MIKNCLSYLLIVAMILTSAPVSATIHFASALDHTTVNTLLSSAAVVAGDTVVLPSGTSVQAGQIVVPTGKHITLQGQGTNSTILYRTAGTVINLGTTRSRVTGIQIQSETPDGNTAFAGVFAEGRGWRVDRCYFRSMNSFKNIGVHPRGGSGKPHPYGLIDWNTFEQMRVDVQGSVGTGFGWTDTYWADAIPMGTTNMIVIENNHFIQTADCCNMIDGEYEGSFTARFNSFTDGTISNHPTGSASGTNERGSRWSEIYGNTFTNFSRSLSSCAIWIRAGGGLIFSNRIVGNGISSKWNKDIEFDNERGWEDGSNPDGTIFTIGPGGYTNQVDGNYAYRSDTQGTHTGANNASVLTYSSGTWTVNEFVTAKEINPAGANPAFNTNLWVHNLTDGSCGRITANTATTVTATLSGGTDNDWDTGDSFVVTGGYPTRDQPGVVQDQTQWNGSSILRPLQNTRPIYIWANVNVGGAGGVNIRNNSGFWIIEGRDYTNTVPGDYTPLVYPHPLATYYDGESEGGGTTGGGGSDSATSLRGKVKLNGKGRVK
jgi:hypothetical protein